MSGLRNNFLLGASVVILLFGGARMALSERAAAAEPESLPAAEAPADASAAIENSVFDVAAADPRFTTLVSLLISTDLVGLLDAPGALTVFAPTNEAFDKLPAETVDALKREENKQLLSDILKRHVVSGAMPAKALQGGAREVATEAGAMVRIDGADGVRIDQAKVVESNIAAANGYVHAIDTVLLPAPPAKEVY